MPVLHQVGRCSLLLIWNADLIVMVRITNWSYTLNTEFYIRYKIGPNIQPDIRPRYLVGRMYKGPEYPFYP